MTQEESYRLTIIGKHLDTTDGIREHVYQKLHKLEKIASHMIDVVVRLSVHKLEHTADISMHLSHFKVQTHATTQDLYQSIDKALERLVSKIRRWKTKIQDHQSKKPSMVEIAVDVLNSPYTATDEINDLIDEENEKQNIQITAIEDAFVKTKSRPLKMLTLQEALVKMELSNDNFLLYRSEEDQKLKVLYRRRDQSFGLLQPE